MGFLLIILVFFSWFWLIVWLIRSWLDGLIIQILFVRKMSSRKRMEMWHQWHGRMHHHMVVGWHAHHVRVRHSHSWRIMPIFLIKCMYLLHLMIVAMRSKIIIIRYSFSNIFTKPFIFHITQWFLFINFIMIFPLLLRFCNFCFVFDTFLSINICWTALCWFHTFFHI